MTKEIEEMNKAIKCLALELPEPVWKDVNQHWQQLRNSLTPSGDVQERAKEYAVREYPILSNGPIAREKELTIHNKIKTAYLSGASSQAGEVERLRYWARNLVEIAKRIDGYPSNWNLQSAVEHMEQALAGEKEGEK